jgi:hypothetical protein
VEAIMRRFGEAWGLVALTALLAGCGSGDGSGAIEPGASPAATTTAPPATSSAPTPDGGAPSSGGTTQWSGRAGGDLGDVGVAIAADAKGDAIIVGNFQDTADLGGVPMTSAGMQDLFLAKLDTTGTPMWARHFGGAGIDLATDVAVGADGNIYVVGTSSADLDFGTGDLTGDAGAGLFLAVFDAYGNTLGARAFGGAAVGTQANVATDAAGDLVISGAYQTPIDLGAGPLPAPAGTYGGFVAKYDPTGALVYGMPVAATGVTSIAGLALDSSGDAVFAGSFAGVLTLGASTLTSAGDYDAFVAKLDPMGTLMGSARFGGTGSDAARSVTVDPSNDITVAGSFSSKVTFVTTPETSAGGLDAFVVLLSAQMMPLWDVHFGGTGDDEALAIAADSAGNVAVGGYFEGSMTVGATPFTSAGGRDAFAVKIDPTGGVAYARYFGSMDDDVANDLTTDGFGHPLATGLFSDTVDFGAGPIASAGDTDVFALTLDP